MHGTGQFSALIAMTGGGAVVSLPIARFDVDRAVRDGRAAAGPPTIVIVGQAFAGPMLEHLDANPGALRPVERRADHARRA